MSESKHQSGYYHGNASGAFTKPDGEAPRPYAAYGRRPRRHSENLQIRLEPHELAAIRRAAEAANLPVSVWVRTVATSVAAMEHNLRVLEKR